MTQYVVWKMHDRGGDEFPISGPVSQEEANEICSAANEADGDCTLWVLPVGRRPFDRN